MSQRKSPKRASSGTTRKRGAGNTLVGIFIGLLLGLALAAAVAYFITKSPSPFQSPVVGAKPDSSKNELGSKPAASTANDKPRFDFYKILPGTEEPKQTPAAPAAEAHPAPASPVSVALPAQPAAPTKAGDRYYLQAGAFQSEADAENQKAKLALLGLEASIQPVALADKNTWYRVRLGPYDSADEMTRSKGELARRGVDASVIKNP